MFESDEVSLLMLIGKVDDWEESKGKRFRKGRLVDIIDDGSNFGETLCIDRHRRPEVGKGIL